MTSSAKDEIREICGKRDYFSTKKPAKLMKGFIRATTNKDSIVMDYFAGSGTIVSEIVAFLNTCDGKIYVGLKDDGTVVGVSNVDEAVLRIADMLSNEILPSP